jgi:cytochrome P450
VGTGETPDLDAINFFDEQVNECPFPAYQTLRDEAPVWLDPATGMFFVTRYEDVRSILLDTKRFSNAIGQSDVDTASKAITNDAKRAELTRIAERLTRLYEEKGWVPQKTLNARDAPGHRQMRRLFDQAFRADKIAALDPFVEAVAYSLIDGFIGDGKCEWIQQFAVPLPLWTIGKQVGVPEEDLPQIKRWTDAWVKRMGLMLTEDEQVWSAEQEIEAQHYFQPIFDRLRRQPDDTLLSDLVNTEIPEWGRTLSDAELHSEMMADLFVGGSETTTNALGVGVVELIRNPNVWDRLTTDTERYLPAFCEEVLRIDSPVQGLLREAAVDVDLHGVTIPKGSPVMLRFGAANRDDRRFECPAEIDLDRERPRSHLAFGAGAHHCLGAPLARRELFYGFKAVVDRFEEMWFLEGNEFRHQPNFFLRALVDLHTGFTRRG